MEFDQWKNKVNTFIRTIIQLDSDCIDDLPYWDLWNKDQDPYEIATYAVSRLGVLEKACVSPPPPSINKKYHNSSYYDNTDTYDSDSDSDLEYEEDVEDKRCNSPDVDNFYRLTDTLIKAIGKTPSYYKIDSIIKHISENNGPVIGV